MIRDISVKVVAGAKRNLAKEENGRWKIYVTAPAIEGKANKALIKFLAEHWGLRKNQIEIIQGLKSKEKLVRIKE